MRLSVISAPVDPNCARSLWATPSCIVVTDHGDTALFRDHVRTDPSPSRHGEPTYEFLDRVDDPVFDRIRRLLDAWLAEFPADHRPDLGARLADSDDRQFFAAFWELYLHQVYLRLGYQPEVHPEVPGTANRPDFLMTPPDGDPFYLEAAAPGEALDELAHRKRLGQIEDSLNRMESPDFFVLFDVEASGTDAPKIRDLRKKLETWLDSLSWKDIRRANEADPFFELPELNLRTKDWSFVFRALPKSEELRGQPGVRPIGGGPMRSGWIDDRAALLAVASRKAKHYGSPPHPLVLALCSDRDFADDEDVNAVLFGQEAMVATSSAPDASWKPIRRPNGLWRGPTGWRNEHVGGVLACHRLKPWAVATVQPKLWLHPGSEWTCAEVGPWTCFEVRSERETLAEASGAFAPEIHLELPDADQFESITEWPGKPFQSSSD
jgi:hypothetical protein